jgi:hypothetical protein
LGIFENTIFTKINSIEIPINTNFYRLRNLQSNYSVKRADLFHVPFEERGKVGSQRYSIPGLPCLYISNSVYLAWEELERLPISSLHLCRIKNVLPLKLVDLSIDYFSGKVEVINKY